jgi:PAS domain S-box-containing protein
MENDHIHYRLLFENMLNGCAYCQMFFDQDEPRDFVYLDVNRMFGDMTGLRDIIGKKATEVHLGIRAADPLLFEIFGRVTLSGQSERFEIYSNSLAMWLAISAYGLENNHFIAIFDNINQRKQAEKALKQSEEKYAKAFLSSPIAITVTRQSDGRFVEINKAVEQLTGYRRDELLGRTSVEMGLYINPADRLVIVQRLRQTGSVRDYECRYVTKNAKTVITRQSLELLEFNGEPCILSVYEDITERKKAEQELRETNLHLEQATIRANSMATQAAAANLAKSEFLANMSHEIRTPMNGIIGMTSLLLDTPLSREQHDYVRTVRNSADALLTIINDILDFSKIEAGKLELEIIDFDLGALIGSLSDLIAIKLRDKALQYTARVEPRVPIRLKGDPGRLRQILINLIGNAIKFTEQGEVRVTVALDHEDEHKARIRFSIEDTGTGIPEEKMRFLFNPFTQADASTTRKYGGTGLGLSICKQLVVLMDGCIDVESHLGVGSRFWFIITFDKQAELFSPVMGEQDFFPAVQADPLRPSHAIPETQRAQYRLLIAEDNVTNQKVVMTLLKKMGYRADAVANGQEAVALLQSVPYDLVFMDIQMPEMDGMAATRLIRERERESGEHIPIIAMTALAMRGDRERCLAAGLDDYIAKPVDPVGIAAKLEQWLPPQEIHQVCKLATPPESLNEPLGVANPTPLVSGGEEVFDRKTLLQRLMGDEELLDTVLGQFRQDLPIQFAVIRTHFENGDALALGRAAHKLSGSAATIGANALRKRVIQIEKAAPTADWSQISPLLAELENQVDIFMKMGKVSRCT